VAIHQPEPSFSAGLAAAQAVSTYRKQNARMDALRVELSLSDRILAKIWLPLESNSYGESLFVSTMFGLGISIVVRRRRDREWNTAIKGASAWRWRIINRYPAHHTSYYHVS
jgi:hypothetical protein